MLQKPGRSRPTVVNVQRWMLPGMAVTNSSTLANILLVADTPAKLLTYQVILGELGEHLISANSAEQALQLLLRNDVALIVADVSMPRLDGFEFAKIVRAHPRYGSTPIIFVSANALSDIDRMQGYASGGVDYVTVPVVPQLLRAKAKVFIELHRKQQELEQLKAELERRVEERTAALAGSEQRYRALVDHANDVVAIFDLEGNITSVNPAIERTLGYAPQEIIGAPLSRFMPEGGGHEEMIERNLRGETAARYEMELLGKDNHRRITLEVSSRAIVDGGGQPIGIHVIARDISERKEAEARQLVLMRELQHRTKNMLAVILSIARNTLSGSKDLEHAREALYGRLHALAHAQEFVAAGAGGGVLLRDLVDAELSGSAARAVVEGEELFIGGAFAQKFALIMHELLTNAVRHGSLAAPQGTVAIGWKVDRSGAEPEFRFSWVERGGSPPQQPKQPGLGTRLVSMVGKATLSYAGEGFAYALVVPLSEAVRGSE